MGLSNATNANIGDTQGVGTITDNDDLPSFSIDDVSQAETIGNMVFTVTRTGDSTQTSTVDFTTNDGSAVSGSDYTAQTGTLTFAAGETTQLITIAISDDAIYEGDESFTIDLSNETALPSLVVLKGW